MWLKLLIINVYSELDRDPWYLYPKKFLRHCFSEICMFVLILIVMVALSLTRYCSSFVFVFMVRCTVCCRYI